MNERVVVVGGGITGLAAAHEARRQGLDAVVLEAATRAGGKIDSGFVDGAELPFPVDMAADGFSPASRKSSNSVTNSAWAMISLPHRRPGVHLGRWCAPFDPHASVLGVPFEPDSVAATGLISEAGWPTSQPESTSNTSPSPATPPWAK